MIFLIPAENVCFRRFPAVFSRTGGVASGGGGGVLMYLLPTAIFHLRIKEAAEYCFLELQNVAPARRLVCLYSVEELQSRPLIARGPEFSLI